MLKTNEILQYFKISNNNKIIVIKGKIINNKNILYNPTPSPIQLSQIKYFCAKTWFKTIIEKNNVNWKFKTIVIIIKKKYIYLYTW